SDLPSFMSYDMAGRTYRYFKGEALYPFGYGLSYTNFTYGNLQAPVQLKKGDTAKVTVTVKNTGSRDGEEVVQLYVSHQNASGKAPIRSLKGFQRIALKAGESKTVSFTLTAEQFSLVNEEGKTYQPTGKIVVSAGGGQPGVKIKTSSSVISKTISIL
ncbi:MAG TPA: fibronectin type III-like domain-contianing protein, partial [Chitinophagaceae bacterium]